MTDRRLVGSVALVIGCMAARVTLESTMWLQMLLQIPLLITAGVLASRVISSEPSWLRRWNRQGISGLVLTAGVVAFWMIPRILDAAVEHVGVDLLKASTVWTVGVIGAVSWRAAGAIVQLFVLGNMAWMMATVGLLLLEAPTRLCVNYGTSDQQFTGYGLLLVTVFAVVKALLRASVPRPLRTDPAFPLPANLHTL